MHSCSGLPMQFCSGVDMLFVIAALIWTYSGRGSFGMALSVGILVATYDSIAAVCAIAPKQLWQFADYRSARERPFLSYLMSSACALTIALPIAYGFNRQILPIMNPETSIAFVDQAKFLLLPTVLSFALAFACDDLIEADHEQWWLKWLESLGIAALMGLTASLIAYWLGHWQSLLGADGAVLNPSLSGSIVNG
ncbi:MAG: hypothetical protein P8Y71_25030 [Pseudolabrys sp.]